MCCAKHLADRGTTVLFVEVWECPEEPVHPTGQEVYPGVFSIPFYAFRSDIRHTFQDNIDAIASAPLAEKWYLCTLPTRELVETARVLRAAGFHVHYDIMDDWESFFEDDREMTHWFSASVELEIVAFADTVTAVSPKLVEKFRRLRTDVVEVRNGYQPSALDCEQFTAARAPLVLPKVVGYFGHFSDAWFDWEALFHAARKHPEIEFELIGYGVSDRSLLRVNGFPNIRFVGLVPQKDLRQYVAKWWAAMIPFQTTALSAAVDPLKVYEYLHFGLPVVVTGIPAVAGYPLVQLAGDPEGFVSALENLPDRPDEQSLSAVAEFLKSCVWAERLAPLEHLLRQPGMDAELALREATLRSDLRYWQIKAAELGRQLEWKRLREAEQERQHLREIERQQLERRWEVDRKQQRIWEVEGELQRLRETEQEQHRLQEAALQAQATLQAQLDERVRIETDLRIRQQHLQDDLETREVEWAARASALGAHVQYWQAKSVDLGKELDEQRQRLQEAVRQFRAMEEHSSSEIRTLTSRADASAYEAANLRRLTTDLLRSRSWKITAPLRFLSKPLFTAPAGQESPAPEAASQQPAAVSATGSSLAHPAPESGNPPDPLEPLWAELRRAPSIAVIPCAVPFRSTFGQRPISFAKSLADSGSTVLYVAWQWSPGEAPPLDGQEVYPRVFHLSLSAFQANLERIASPDPLRREQSEPDPRPRERSEPDPRPLAPGPREQSELFLCSLPTPALVEAVRPLRAGGYHIHYDIMDDWEEFHRAGEAPWYSASVERELVMLSDTVTVVSAGLAAKFARLRNDIVEVRNGYDPAALGCRQFVAARAPLERPKVVGYFGHLSDAWFDWEAVLEAARKLPDVAFELIGYGLSDRSRAHLGDFANVRFHGLVSQNDLHRYAKRWWVGIIPFRPSTLSAAVDPLKIYEYLHIGLPTVVTGVSGIADYPLVHFAKDRAGFLTALEQVQDRPGEQSLQEVADFLKACTWEARLARLHTLIGQPAGIASLYAR
jgi:glycosyltransferase involved in cell wall biosynthesis